MHGIEAERPIKLGKEVGFFLQAGKPYKLGYASCHVHQGVVSMSTGQVLIATVKPMEKWVKTAIFFRIVDLPK